MLAVTWAGRSGVLGPGPTGEGAETALSHA
jgi:hypothetical protein